MWELGRNCMNPPILKLEIVQNAFFQSSIGLLTVFSAEYVSTGYINYGLTMNWKCIVGTCIVVSLTPASPKKKAACKFLKTALCAVSGSHKLIGGQAGYILTPTFRALITPLLSWARLEESLFSTCVPPRQTLVKVSRKEMAHGKRPCSLPRFVVGMTPCVHCAFSEESSVMHLSP